MSDYELLDSGDGRKLERFGDVTLVRPAAQAVWRPQRPDAWTRASASFDREEGNRWHNREALPEQWVIEVDGLRFRLAATDFGHLGLFPEQRAVWATLRDTIRRGQARDGCVYNVLNLFAYSGGATLAAAQAGAAVCHLDASQGMVRWARENARLNSLEDAPVRWIVDDVKAFLKREVKRRRYDGIILDPPSFGRGQKGQVFKVQEDLVTLLDFCRDLLTDEPAFLVLTSHTPELSPLVLGNLLRQWLAPHPGDVVEGEMTLTGAVGVLPLPAGAYACWTARRVQQERSG